jgi:hypothetical protein
VLERHPKYSVVSTRQLRTKLVLAGHRYNLRQLAASRGWCLPGVAPVLFGNGSTATKDTSRSIAAPSLTVSSSTLCFERLGLEATTLEKEEEESIQKSAQGELKRGTCGGQKNSYHDISSLLTAKIVALHFWAVTHGFLGGWARVHHQASLCLPVQYSCLLSSGSLP